MSEKKFYDVWIWAGRNVTFLIHATTGHHQWRLPLVITGINIGSGIKQKTDTSNIISPNLMPKCLLTMFTMRDCSMRQQRL